MKEHKVTGANYVILTDHISADGFLTALEKLATYRNGTILRLDDLGSSVKDAEGRALLKERLMQLDPKYVAIAPKMSSFRENVVLGLYEVFSSLDCDEEKNHLIGVYPGFLLAPNVV